MHIVDRSKAAVSGSSVVINCRAAAYNRTKSQQFCHASRRGSIIGLQALVAAQLRSIWFNLIYASSVTVHSYNVSLEHMCQKQGNYTEQCAPMVNEPPLIQSTQFHVCVPILQRLVKIDWFNCSAEYFQITESGDVNRQRIPHAYNSLGWLIHLISLSSLYVR